jgi:hypothetical protein
MVVGIDAQRDRGRDTRLERFQCRVPGGSAATLRSAHSFGIRDISEDSGMGVHAGYQNRFAPQVSRFIIFSHR